MNCAEFESALESAVEERQPPVEHVLEHASACLSCRQLLGLQQQLDQVIESWQPADPSAGFADRVLAELSKPVWDDNFESIAVERVAVPSMRGVVRLETPASELARLRSMTVADASQTLDKAVRRSHRLAMVSVVASLLFVGLTMSLVSSIQSGSFNRLLTSSRSHPMTADEVASLDVSDTIAEVFSDLKSEYREMATNTSVAAREFVDAIPEIAPPPLPDADDLDLLPDSSDMKRLWRPIRSRVSTALGFLWQTVPSEIPAG